MPEKTVPHPDRIAVIGGGFTGLVLAWRLAGQGRAVTVFENSPQPGGLATYHDYGGFLWDRFYHVILPQDAHLLGLIGELGLSETLVWSRPQTGFYVAGTFYPFTTPADLLRFPHLSLPQKLRLALGTAWAARLANPAKLRDISLADWLIPVFGQAVFEQFWKPLLLAKLGEAYRETSALFLWTYLRRLYAARSGANRREMLGHVSGGYHAILARLESGIAAAGGEVRCHSPVLAVKPARDRAIAVDTANSSELFDRVFFTGPASALRAVTPPGFLPPAPETLYLGVICLVLVTEQPLLPFYVTNLADSAIPFTGIVCVSNVVGPAHTGGSYLTYFPKYLAMNDPLFDRPAEKLSEMFFQAASRLFPDLSKGILKSSHLHMARRVQPIQTVGQANPVPPVATGHPSLFLINSAQFATNTLNNDAVVEHLTKVLPGLI